jgi:phage baseplate assembly protein W
MASYGFSIPFSFNSLGRTETVTESKEIWRSRVYLVLLTKFGERLMRPDFGTDLASTLFENHVLATEIATRTVGIAFNKWLSGLKLIETVPVYNKDTGLLNVTVRYSLPSGSTDEVIISTATFNRAGELIQE